MEFTNEKYKDELSFDLEKIDQLVQLGRELNEDVLSQLLQLHFETSEAELKEIQQFTKQQDFVAIQKGVHKLKSSCGTLGLNKMHRLSSDLEKYLSESKSIRIETVQGFLDCIFNEYQLSKKMIQEFQLKLGV